MSDIQGYSNSAQVKGFTTTKSQVRQSERAVDVHPKCVRSITTSKSAGPVVNRGTADEVTGSDPVISSDMTVELQPLSAQMGYMHVLSLSDQAEERVPNCPECNGAVSSQLHYTLVTMFEAQALEKIRSSPEVMAAEEWRKASLKHEPDVGIQYDANAAVLAEETNW